MKRYVLFLTLASLAGSPPLLAAAPGAGPAVAAQAAPSENDKIKCRSIAVTGSLVRREKVCKTVGEWRRISLLGNERVRDLVATGATCGGGTCGNGN